MEKRSKGSNMNDVQKTDLVETPGGLTLVGQDMEIRGDFTRMLQRIRENNLRQEFIVKACRVKKTALTKDNPESDETDKNGSSGEGQILTAVDATAGLGEDSFLLAAAGFHVTMFEKDPVIAALLKDALRRAAEDERLAAIVSRMTLVEGDSITGMKELSFTPDVIVLDPMFPERQKSAAVKKKFQLLHYLEKPCDNEEELLQAAMDIRPKKIVIKRPLKGPLLADIKPSYSLTGKAIRYDCIVLA